MVSFSCWKPITTKPWWPWGQITQTSMLSDRKRARQSIWNRNFGRDRLESSPKMVEADNDSDLDAEATESMLISQEDCSSWLGRCRDLNESFFQFSHLRPISKPVSAQICDSNDSLRSFFIAPINISTLLKCPLDFGRWMKQEYKISVKGNIRIPITLAMIECILCIHLTVSQLESFWLRRCHSFCIHMPFLAGWFPVMRLVLEQSTISLCMLEKMAATEDLTQSEWLNHLINKADFASSD